MMMGPLPRMRMLPRSVRLGIGLFRLRQDACAARVRTSAGPSPRGWAGAGEPRVCRSERESRVWRTVGKDTTGCLRQPAGTPGVGIDGQPIRLGIDLLWVAARASLRARVHERGPVPEGLGRHRRDTALSVREIASMQGKAMLPMRGEQLCRNCWDDTGQHLYYCVWLIQPASLVDDGFVNPIQLAS